MLPAKARSARKRGWGRLVIAEELSAARAKADFLTEAALVLGVERGCHGRARHHDSPAGRARAPRLGTVKERTIVVKPVGIDAVPMVGAKWTPGGLVAPMDGPVVLCVCEQLLHGFYHKADRVPPWRSPQVRDM